MMGNWRTWHMMERPDGSVSLYYTQPDDPAQHVVYDTLDGPRMSLLARAEAAEAECKRLREQVAQAKADGANEERSLHWMRENMELANLRKQVAALTAELAELSAEHMALIERTAD